jgi:hypothetical protein
MNRSDKYIQAGKLRERGLLGNITENLVEGRGSIAGGVGRGISETLGANISGIKEYFDPLNIAKKMTGGLGSAIVGRATGRSKEDMNYFLGKTPAKTEAPTASKLGNVNTALYTNVTEGSNAKLNKNERLANIAAKLYVAMKTSYEIDKLEKELARNFSKEMNEEDQRRHDELIKAIGKPQKPAKVKTESKKLEKQIGKAPSPAPAPSKAPSKAPTPAPKPAPAPSKAPSKAPTPAPKPAPAPSKAPTPAPAPAAAKAPAPAPTPAPTAQKKVAAIEKPKATEVKAEPKAEAPMPPEKKVAALEKPKPAEVKPEPVKAEPAPAPTPAPVPAPAPPSPPAAVPAPKPTAKPAEAKPAETKPTAAPAPAPATPKPSATKEMSKTLSGRAAQLAVGLAALGITSKSAIAAIVATSAKESGLDPFKPEDGVKPWRASLDKRGVEYLYLKFPQLAPGGRVAKQLGFEKTGVPVDYIRGVMDKGDEAWFTLVYPGGADAYKYRGRGLIQITGKGVYEKIGNIIGVDLVKDPDAITRDFDTAAKATGAYLMNALGGGNSKKGLDVLNSFTSEQEALKWIIGNVASGSLGTDKQKLDKLFDPTTNIGKTTQSQLEKAQTYSSLGAEAASGEKLNSSSIENADAKKQSKGQTTVIQDNSTNVTSVGAKQPGVLKETPRDLPAHQQ